MAFTSMLMSLAEIKKFALANQLEIDSVLYHDFTKDEMLQYIKDNIGKVACYPVCYYGNVISAIRIEEVVNGQNVISYWNVVDD